MKMVFAIAVVLTMIIGGSVAVAQTIATDPTQGTYAGSVSYNNSTSSSGAIISPHGSLTDEGNSNTDVGSNDASSSSVTNVGSSPIVPVETSRSTFGDYFEFVSVVFFFGLLLYARVVSDYEKSRALISPQNK